MTPDLLQAFALKPGTKGALVQSVVPRSPAEKAGLKAGDVITQLNGKTVDSSGALTRGVALVAPGQVAALTVVRGTNQKQFSLKVGQRPEEENAVGRGEAPEVEPEGKDVAAKLGMALAPVTGEVQSQLGLENDEGMVVTNVQPEGPADRAGLRRGDVILELNRQAVRQPEEVKALLAKVKDNDLVLLRVRRGDQASFLTVRVGGK